MVDCLQEEKGFFYDQLPRELPLSPKNDISHVSGEFNCHLGRCVNEVIKVHGNQGLKTCNKEGFGILDL